MNTVSNFHSSLYILHRCHENIETVFFEFDKYPKEGFGRYSNPVLRILHNYLILEAASFLEEYEYNFLEIPNRPIAINGRSKNRIHPIEAEFCTRIEDLHRALSPLLNVLNRWTEIKQYRNNYVAHGQRADWNAGNKLSIPGQECYDAPRSFAEFQIMRDVIHLIFGIISQEFKMELIDAEFLANTRKPVVNPLKDNSKIDIELSAMIASVEEETKKQDKQYSLNVPDLYYQHLQKSVSEMPLFAHPLTFERNYIRNNQSEIVKKMEAELAVLRDNSEKKKPPIKESL